MGAVLAGTLVFSDAVPLRASASAGTEKSAVQNETVSGTENGTETKRAAVYVNLKTGDDTADGTTAETAVKTVEKAQELLAVAAAELQADGKKHCCRYQQNGSGGSSRKISGIRRNG